jgi:hypothetical protein
MFGSTQFGIENNEDDWFGYFWEKYGHISQIHVFWQIVAITWLCPGSDPLHFFASSTHVDSSHQLATSQSNHPQSVQLDVQSKSFRSSHCWTDPWNLLRRFCELTWNNRREFYDQLTTNWRQIEFLPALDREVLELFPGQIVAGKSHFMLMSNFLRDSRRFLRISPGFDGPNTMADRARQYLWSGFGVFAVE